MTTLAGGLQADDEPEELSTEPSITRRRAPRIMRVDVFRAADELLVQGDRPSIDRVRMRIGRGSPNTINDHLDAWWKNLGSRLRDLPGREFPQLPERVAQSLQNLWNEALAGAHEVLQDTWQTRQQNLVQRESELERHAREVKEREEAAAGRAAAMDEALRLAREQLTAANKRAERLEASLLEGNTAGERQRVRLEQLDDMLSELTVKREAAESAYHAERTRLEGRNAAAEARWLAEVDRARQAQKNAAREHERQLKALRGETDSLRIEREDLRRQLAEARYELKSARAMRDQMEAQLRHLQKGRPNRISTAPQKRSPRRPS